MARLTLNDSVKFKQLTLAIGLPRPYVRGLLETLWDVANATGSPIIGSENGVEAAAEWPGETGELFAALRDLVWIEQAEDGRWMIHDYWQHCPDYVLDRLRRELERRGVRVRRDDIRSAAREKPSELREHLLRAGPSGIIPDNPGQQGKSSGLSSAPTRAPTPPCMDSASVSPEKVDRRPKRSNTIGVRRRAGELGFNEFWEIWPNKKAKRDAETAFVFDLEDEERRVLADRTADYLSRRQEAEKAGADFVPNIPLAPTFIRGRRWEDSFTPSKQSEVDRMREEIRREEQAAG